MLSKEDKLKLAPFFTNLNKKVFVLLNMPEVLRGALFSRYSRSVRPLRELFLEEYLKDGNSGFLEAGLDFSKVTNFHSLLVTEKAEKFYNRWLAEYGDDSIAELGGAHVGIEGISVLATKALEDRRLGLSFLEKSTRYVRFDDKVNGSYKYYKDSNILNSRYGKLYEETCNSLFDTYSELISPMTVYFKTKFPKALEISEKAYETSIRAKACDTLRGLLPLSTLTNMGVFGNGRAYEYMLTKMFATSLREAKIIAEEAYTELSKVIPNFIERIKTEKGSKYINYFDKTEKALENITQKFISKKTNDEKVKIELVDYDKDAEYKTVASILFTKSNIPLRKLLSLAKKMGKNSREKILKTYYGEREGKWHKIGRAFEEAYYEFEIVSDFGAYKDLERHRVMTQEKQMFSCDLGFDVPKDVVDAGFEKTYRKAMDKAKKAFEKTREKFPIEAQYLVTHGYKVRYKMKMNLREAFHLCELRSSPQGHPNYRFIAQEIYKKIKEVHPSLAEGMKFVNMENPGLERLSSEIRKEEKVKFAYFKS